MRAFEYASPTSMEQAVSLLGNSWDDAAPLAGGTDLLSLMKDDIVTPKRLVNIKQLPDMHAIANETDRERRGNVRLGALVTPDQLANAASIREKLPMLARAAEEAASPQIRN